MTTATGRVRPDLPVAGRAAARATDGVGPAPGLQLVGVSRDLGGRRIVDELNLTVAEGELVCLLGPSGCGKTTTLRMIGGFLRPDTGSVVIAGAAVTDLSPDRRPTAMVFQNYALWPHMTVRANVAFGLKVQKVSRADTARRVDQALEMVNLTHHRDSYPARISGGEQQRAALARALVLRPKVLLLDEPLSNLDAKLRVQVREDIRAIQRELAITTVLVTHDQDEALSVSDRVAVMNRGRIEQLSTPRELYRRPATRFVAEFVGGMNLFSATTSPGAVVVAGQTIPVSEPMSTPSGNGSLLVGVRPEDIRLSRPAAGAQQPVPARVVGEVPRGSVTEVLVDLAGTRIRAVVAGDVEAASAWPDGRVQVGFVRALSYVDEHLLPAAAGS